MILPWLVLAAATAAIYARYMRASMIDTMAEDYIRTARAKGLPERAVILAPRRAQRDRRLIVTLLGTRYRPVCWPATRSSPRPCSTSPASAGWSSPPSSDPTYRVQGVTLFGAFFIIIFNLIVDIAYAYLDPRVRYQ